MKAKKVIVGIVFGLIIGIITIIALLYLLLVWVGTGGPPKKIKGAAHYEETLQKYTTVEYGKVHTAFVCFPQKIPESAFADGKEPTFYFFYQNTINEPTCEGYLYCEYSEKDYLAEIERLSQEKNLLQDTEGRFPYPVYIAVDHSEYSYEYAILPENNTIAYIYTAWCTTEEGLQAVPKEYLPFDFEDSLTPEKGSRIHHGYNIYLYPDSTRNITAPQ